MLEITGNSSYFTETREKPRKKYVNWRYKSPSVSRRRPNTATGIRLDLEKTAVKEPITDVSKSVKFDHGDLDLVTVDKFFGSTESSEERTNQLSDSEDFDSSIRTYPRQLSRFEENLKAAENCRSKLNRSSLNLTCVSKRANAKHSASNNLEEEQQLKLEQIDKELTEMRLKLKFLQQEEEKLLLENSLKLSKSATFDSNKWYELRNPDFCMGASRNNKLLAKNKSQRSIVNYKKDLLKMSKTFKDSDYE